MTAASVRRCSWRWVKTTTKPAYPFAGFAEIGSIMNRKAIPCILFLKGSQRKVEDLKILRFAQTQLMLF